jgi:hypothetical protein
MSLTSPVPDENGIAHSAAGLPCSCCGEKLSDPALYWMFADDNEMYLHPDCWPQLSAAVWRDYHEVKNPAYYERRRLAATSCGTHVRI